MRRSGLVDGSDADVLADSRALVDADSRRAYCLLILKLLADS